MPATAGYVKEEIIVNVLYANLLDISSLQT